MSDKYEKAIKRIQQGAKQVKEITTLHAEKPTTENIDPDGVLAYAYENLQDVVIVGYDKEEEFYFASSVADGGTVLWLIEHLKAKLMGIPTGEEEED